MMKGFNGCPYLPLTVATLVLKKAHPLIKVWLLPLYLVELGLEAVGIELEND